MNYQKTKCKLNRRQRCYKHYLVLQVILQPPSPRVAMCWLTSNSSLCWAPLQVRLRFSHGFASDVLLLGIFR
jgi:hypothetical protein